MTDVLFVPVFFPELMDYLNLSSEEMDFFIDYPEFFDTAKFVVKSANSYHDKVSKRYHYRCTLVHFLGDERAFALTNNQMKFLKMATQCHAVVDYTEEELYW